MPNTFEHLEIPELVLITGDVYKDSRGYFFESYKQSEFQRNRIPETFVQDNFSFSIKNVLRGLHYQLPPKAQGKLVRVLEGRIWDVAVDIRKGSKTFKKFLGLELDSESGQALYIPPGFAHGFVVLSENARVLYKTTAEYDKDLEKGILWNDLDLNISWAVENPIVSEKDLALPSLSSAEIF